MAAVFACVRVLVVGALALLGAAYRRGRADRALLAVAAAPPALVLASLVAKLVYEERYPCFVVHPRCCDFASTQHHNLFGRAF